MIFSFFSALILFVLLNGWVPAYAAAGISVLLFLTRPLLHEHQGGDLLILETIAQGSRLKALDPLVKFLVVLGTIILVVGWKAPLLMAVLVCGIFLYFSLLEKHGLHTFFDLMKGPLVFIFTGLLGILIDFSRVRTGVYTLPMGSVSLIITGESIARARELFAVSFTSVALLITLGATTPMGDLISAMRRIHMPEIFIEIMYLTYRYLFNVVSLFNRLNTAAKVRFGYEGVKTTIKTVSLVASKLLNRSMRLAFLSMDAMESRLYDGKVRFLENQFSKRWGIIFLAVYAALVAVIVGIGRIL